MGHYQDDYDQEEKESRKRIKEKNDIVKEILRKVFVTAQPANRDQFVIKYKELLFWLDNDWEFQLFNNNNFELITRPYGNCWKHKTQDSWIVYYESLDERKKPSYITYESTVNCPEGRDPWTVNNRRTGEFFTLKEAMDYIDKG